MILVVDDEAPIRTVLTDFLSQEGYRVVAVASALEALAALSSQAMTAEVLLTDLSLPGDDGVTLISKAKAAGFDGASVIMTGHGSIEAAIRAMKVGAVDFFLKPLELDAVGLRLKQILKLRALEAKTDRLERELGRRSPRQQIVTQSGKMKKLLQELTQAAATDATILLTGETGVGKEVLARFVHEQSKRNAGPFVPINCGAIPENLVESELFGHERGAFTGAESRTNGVFQQAQSGTLFLDEIGEMPLRIQPSLLRALEEKKVKRVGASVEQEVDCRWIAATHRDLAKSVKQGQFREDLFFRLNVVQIEIPPLRDRRDDIPDLVKHFVRLHGTSLNRRVEKISAAFMERLLRHSFPGNVRELSNLVERALIFSEGEELSENALDGALVASAPPLPEVEAHPELPLAEQIALFETQVLSRAIQNHAGDLEAVGKTLQLPKSTLYDKIKKYGLSKRPPTAG